MTDDLRQGIINYDKNGTMDALMEFLVRYVRHVHSDTYYKNMLMENPGATFLDIITPSDVAYVVALMENSRQMWTTPSDEDGNKVRPLFTSGDNMKRTYGMNIWNEDGMDFYESAYMFWHAAFNTRCDHYKILQKHWDKWIGQNGKTLLIGKSEHSKKTAYSVLATRDAADVRRRAKKDTPRQVKEFKYDSDDEGGNICAGNWGAGSRSTSRRSSRACEELDEQVSESDNGNNEEDDDASSSGSSSSDDEGNGNINGKRNGEVQSGNNSKRRG